MSNILWTEEEKQVFSKIQMEVFNMKALGASQDKITEKYEISSHTIYTAIRYTLAGNYWEPQKSTGGGISYLGDADVILFKKKIKENHLDLNCLKTIEAVQLAYELRADRYHRALYLYSICKVISNTNRFKRFLFSLEPYVASETWINHFCSRNGIILKNPETLTEARRKCCNLPVINKFFSNNKKLLKETAPANIWNADESSSITTQRYKVLLTENCRHAITPTSAYEPHITAMFCFNAIGDRMDPFIILPKLANVPQELKSIRAFYCSQSSGWMTKALFGAFCVYFVSKISHYKLLLSKPECDQPTILLVDNHSSRFNSFAIEYLAMHNVILLTFPPHCSHLLQPHQMAAARSLKSSMAKIQITKSVKDAASKLKSKAAMTRYKTVYSVVEAWKNIPSDVLVNGFIQSGLFEFDPSKVTSSELINKNIKELDTDNTGLMLTSDKMRLEIYNRDSFFIANTIEEIMLIEYDLIKVLFNSGSDAVGIKLSKFPPLILKISENNYQKIDL